MSRQGLPTSGIRFGTFSATTRTELSAPTFLMLPPTRLLCPSGKSASRRRRKRSGDMLSRGMYRINVTSLVSTKSARHIMDRCLTLSATSLSYGMPLARFLICQTIKYHPREFDRVGGFNLLTSCLDLFQELLVFEKTPVISLLRQLSLLLQIIS